MQVWCTLNFKTFVFSCPCAGLVHFEVQNFDIFCPCAGFRQGVGLQSSPNLHRDKKTQVLNFKLHQTCTGTKKTKVLNFKLHQTCTGTKKTKSFELQSAPNLHRDKKKTKKSQSTWEGATIPLKFFFVPVQVWCTLKFKTFVFLSLCRFGAL